MNFPRLSERGVRFKPGQLPPHTRNLTGQRFGHLTALEPISNPPAPRTWRCACDCGGSKIVATSSLLTGRCSHCGCQRRGRDLTGQTLGHWTVLGFAERRGTTSRWNCRCVCGIERAVVGRYLATGRSTSCGCRKGEAQRATRAFAPPERVRLALDDAEHRSPNVRDLTGHRFHGWRVLAFVGRDARHQSRWLARCETCGTQREFLPRQLREGKPLCRCLPPRARDLTGQRFGRWMVVRYAGSTGHGAIWTCRCDCGTERAVRAIALTKGRSKSCGCAGKTLKSLDFSVNSCVN